MRAGKPFFMAAGTGRFVFGTLHTSGASKTIDRVIDVFSPNQQRQIRVRLSTAPRAVVPRQLLPTVDGALEPASERMLANGAVQNMIRGGKARRMDDAIQAGAQAPRRYEAGRVARETALLFAGNAERPQKKIDGR